MQRHSSTTLPAAYPAYTKWVVIACAWLFYVYEYILRVSPSVLEKELMIDYQTTATMVGTLSAAYYWLYVPLQIPCGVIADRFGAKRVIALSTVLCIIGCLLFSLTYSVGGAMAGRLFMGAGSACAYICCAKVAAQWFKREQFAVLAGATMLLGTTGGSLNTVFSLCVQTYTWRTTFLLSAVLGGLVLALTLIFMKDEQRKPISKDPVQSTSLLEGLTYIAKNPQNWLLGIYGCMMYLPLCAFAELWGTPFLSQMYGIATQEASMACAAVFVGMGLGSIMSAWVSLKIGSKTKVMAWSAFGTLISFLIVFFVPSLPFTMMGIVLFIGGLLSGGQTLYFAVSKEQTPLAYSATSVAFINALVMCSSIVFQPLLGKILDMTWAGQLNADGSRLYTVDNYQAAFVAVAMAFLVAWILMFFIKEKDPA